MRLKIVEITEGHEWQMVLSDTVCLAFVIYHLVFYCITIFSYIVYIKKLPNIYHYQVIHEALHNLQDILGLFNLLSEAHLLFLGISSIYESSRY